jgi:hypothetical protein
VLGLPLDRPEIDNLSASFEPYVDECARYDALDLENTLNEQAKQACTIGRPFEEYLESEHGKANAKTCLYEVHRRELPNNKAWW